MPKRCPNGSRRNSKTKQCVKRTSAKKSAKKSATNKPVTQNIRNKSYVFITGPRMWAGEYRRVAQVVGQSNDGKKYAVRLNYNGALAVRNKKYIRVPTEAEKRADKKEHNRSLTIDFEEREQLNNSWAPGDSPV